MHGVYDLGWSVCELLRVDFLRFSPSRGLGRMDVAAFWVVLHGWSCICWDPKIWRRAIGSAREREAWMISPGSSMSQFPSYQTFDLHSMSLTAGCRWQEGQLQGCLSSNSNKPNSNNYVIICVALAEQAQQRAAVWPHFRYHAALACGSQKWWILHVVFYCPLKRFSLTLWKVNLQTIIRLRYKRFVRQAGRGTAKDRRSCQAKTVNTW